MSQSLIHKLALAAEAYASLPAILTDTRTLTHGELGLTSQKIAHGLQHLGITKGDRIALYARNGIPFVEAYLSIIKAGAVVVPINLLIHPDEILYILKDSGARALIVEPELIETIARIGDLSSLNWIVSTGAATELATTNLDALKTDKAHHNPLEINPEEDLAAILYTSGTTGYPKGAMLTHANLVANTQSVHEAMCWREGLDRVLVVLPMFHAFAATVGLLTPLTHGSALIPLMKFEPEAVADTIQRHQATLFLGVPSMFTVLLKLKESKIPAFQSLRFCISGGAALPVAILESFKARFGLSIYEGDGPTECSPVTCVNPIGGLIKPGTVGLPVPNVEMRIIDDNGETCPIDTVGEIAVRGPNVMKGYWNRPLETQEVFRGEWLLTGDLGTCDADGYFSIVDRKKDLIIVNGMNVYPRMIEEIIHQCSGVKEVAVVGELNDRHGEIPVAYVAVDETLQNPVAQLKNHCKAHLGRHQIPKRFVILETLPKNATGKILKRELRKHGEVERGIISQPI